jgi:copper chaperone CopZ
MKTIYNTVLLLAAAIFLSLSNATAQNASSADSVVTAVVKVKNLHCNGDMPTIKKRLLNQEGVEEVSFTDRVSDISSFKITYHTSATNAKAIEKAIETTPGCDDQSETPYRVVKDRSKKK